ncbi:hypothetical protein GOP47_0024554 [Adiantum capillus-veneris]|uniref:Uncharacterized protein n=1 Tax=Adiantum capillus-veneris TaxID=13818 RepID=A0A9D4U4A1_ADICA|nr:hypothetical protein GOP47_0024554 [Adiantum capillus-veneris]
MRLPKSTRAARETTYNDQNVCISIRDAASCAAFIIKVQHLIERCLTFYMDAEECVKALYKHAGIHPIVTTTVWKELEKANHDFFQDYHKTRLTRKSCHFRKVLRDFTNKLASGKENMEVTKSR